MKWRVEHENVIIFHVGITDDFILIFKNYKDEFPA